MRALAAEEVERVVGQLGYSLYVGLMRHSKPPHQSPHYLCHLVPVEFEGC